MSDAKKIASTNGTAPLTVLLLGQMQVLVQGQPLPRLRSRKSYWLLALLALRSGRPVNRAWLAGTLWPEAEQTQAFANMRSVLSELRRALGDQGERLQSPNNHTLYLESDGADIDVVDFDAAIGDASLPNVERAVALYRGALLEGCTEEWVSQERAQREQACVGGMVRLAEATRAEGDLTTSARHYRRAIGLDPWSDALQRGLMETLVQIGDRNGALQVYREFAAILGRESSAIPDEQTRALYARIRSETRRAVLNDDASRSEARIAAPTAPATINGYLPHALTDLIGREEEQDEVIERLQRARLVTLTGPGGIGKTRLSLAVAQEAASRFPDGVWLVSLEALTDGERIAFQIAGVFDLKEESNRTVLDTLTDHLKTRRLLVILDNCEHLLEASATIVTALLRACAGIRILATSRQALGITGETVWAVPPLAVPNPTHMPESPMTLQRVLPGYEGVRLFLERAQAVQNEFVLTSVNARAVARICAGLEGIPLAIELAAARVRAMTATQIAERLGDHLSLLTGGSRTSLSRQQTLRAAIDWSYVLLSDTERLLLARLSIFAGGWTLEATEHVCSDDSADDTGASTAIASGQILELLTNLVDKSLVIFGMAPDESDSRYRMLETVRQYAAERLSEIESGAETERVRARHRAWLVTLLNGAKFAWRGPDQAIWRRRLDTEYSNLQATLQRDGAISPEAAEADLFLVGLLGPLWYVRGQFREGRAYIEAALGRENALAPSAARADALHAASVLAYSVGDYAVAQRMSLEGLSIRRESGNKSGVISALQSLSNISFLLGDYAAAAIQLEEVLAISQQTNNVAGISFALESLGNVEIKLGNHAKARLLFDDRLEIARTAGDKQGIAHILCSLGAIACNQEAWEDAQAFYEESLRLSKELRHKGQIALVLFNLATIEQHRGTMDSATEIAQEAHDLFVEIGNRWGMAGTFEALAYFAYRKGEFSFAAKRHQEALRIRSEIGDRDGIARSIGYISYVLIAWNSPRDAARFLGAAQVIRDSLGTPIDRQTQTEYDSHVRQARAALGEDAYAEAFEYGRAATTEETVAYALVLQSPT